MSVYMRLEHKKASFLKKVVRRDCSLSSELIHLLHLILMITAAVLSWDFKGLYICAYLLGAVVSLWAVFCDGSYKFPGWTQGWSGPGWHASLAQTWLGSRHSCTLGLVRCELRWRREENTQVEAGSSHCIHTHKHQEKNDSLKGQREL